jgi:replicative DNA helicase
MKKAGEIIAKIEADKKHLEFLPTGLSRLDEFLDGGFLRKELIVLGGGTGVGKSYFAGQILFNLAKLGYKTAYFSLEISNEMVVSRFIGQAVNIKPTKMIIGTLTDEENHKKNKARTEILAHEDYMGFYDDIYDFSELTEEIQSKTYDFIVIDFIQNIEVPSMVRVYERLTYIARQLQKLAKEKDVCILTVSQLSNEVARGGKDGKVEILEYSGSGSIAHACDLGFFLQRAEITNPNAMFVDKFNAIKLTLKKNRRGVSPVAFALRFINPGGVFEEEQI